jgi:hypothetical protein
MRMNKFLQHRILLEQCPYPFPYLEMVEKGVHIMR